MDAADTSMAAAEEAVVVVERLSISGHADNNDEQPGTAFEHMGNAS